MSIGDEQALQRVLQEGLRPLSVHAFLAFLAQHPGVERGLPGISLPQPTPLNGYSCLLRILQRSRQPRHLQFLAVHRIKGGGYLLSLLADERFAVEPVREDAASERNNGA